MTTEITIYPEPERNLSPYQQKMAKGYDYVNDNFLGEGGISFKSVLDVFNPLQQLPIISTAYREISGDTISSGSRLLGGALIGGPIGFAVALLNEIVQGATGKDIGSNAFAAVSGKYEESSKLV